MIHFSKQDFKISCEPGPHMISGGSRMVSGWISDDGLWGISKQKWIGKNKDKFKITHLRTGMNIKRGLERVNSCKIICNELSKQKGRWGFGVFGIKPVFSKREKTVLENAVKQAALGI